MPVSEIVLKVARIIGLFFLASYMTIVFLFSGLLCNLLQYLLYVALYDRNRQLYRKINYYLIYFVWIQIVAVYEWRSNSSCNIYGSEESLRMFGKEHCFIVMNHKYDIDWLVCWYITNHLRVMANSKSCAKKQLSRVPVIGWSWSLSEFIFLERNWEKDKLTLGDKLDKIADYEDPTMILYFCEGTRFTAEKHKASLEFAKSRELPLLEHHLCPRTSGFNFAAKHLKNKIPAVYNIQIGFPPSEKKPTFSNLFRGYSFCPDLYIERIKIQDVATDSDVEASKWLHELYVRKDKLQDDYYKTGKYPGQCVHIKRSYRSLINSVFWAIVIGIPWAYIIITILTTGNTLLTSLIVTIFSLLLTLMYFMVRATKADKGSSYGKDKGSPETTKNGTNPRIQITDMDQIEHEADIKAANSLKFEPSNNNL